MATPWFPMYPTDFLVSTATMTAIQGWAYTQLLMYAWTNGGIPDDREACATLTRCQISEHDWVVIRGRFELMAQPMAQPLAQPMARLVNPRMERERAKARERHNERSESGKRGSDARWGEKNGSANGSAQALRLV